MSNTRIKTHELGQQLRQQPLARNGNLAAGESNEDLPPRTEPYMHPPVNPNAARHYGPWQALSLFLVTVIVLALASIAKMLLR